MSMIFQSYALWPHMTVAENVAYGLELRKLDRDDDRAASSTRSSATTQLGALADRYPGELSGGQQQRVALARALIVEPETLLLDEPLSNLDANLREEMRFEVRRLHDEYRYTTVYVTHDQSEAMTTADLIAVMNHGKIEQAGSPEDIYDRPRSEFVARFIGSSNVIKGKALDDNHVSFCRRAAALRRRHARRRRATAAVSIRQHDIGLSRGAAARGRERRAGDGGAAGLSRRQPRLSGRAAGRHPAARRDVAGREHRAGRRGLAASAAGKLPRAERMSGHQRRHDTTTKLDRRGTMTKPIISRRDVLKGSDRARGVERVRVARAGGRAAGERGHAGS